MGRSYGENNRPVTDSYNLGQLCNVFYRMRMKIFSVKESHLKIFSLDEWFSGEFKLIHHKRHRVSDIVYFGGRLMPVQVLKHFHIIIGGFNAHHQQHASINNPEWIFHKPDMPEPFDIFKGDHYNKWDERTYREKEPQFFVTNQVVYQ